MAVNTKNYTCDYCGKGGLEYKEVNSIHLEGYIHTDDNLCRGDRIASLDFCKSCYASLRDWDKKNLLSKLRSILCRITTLTSVAL